MPYSTNHLGITFELHSAGEEGPVNILINPSFQTMGFEPTIIGSVYLNGRQMVDMGVHDGYDIEKLIKLRKTLEIETDIPSTRLPICVFAGFSPNWIRRVKRWF